RTSVVLSRRADVTAALIPAIPPPAITTSNFFRSTPGIDGDGRDIIRAEHLPRPLGLSAHHDDVDLLRLVHLHDLVRRGLETRCVWLDTGDGARPHQRLHPLIIPIVPRRKARIVGAPINERLL